MMMHQKAPTQEDAVARTWVIWDIKSCPLPFECDARRVGPCIKRALENLGYSGPLTITAIGHLIDVPQNVLRSVSSTGISLHHIPGDAVNILNAMAKWGVGNKHSDNILLISARDFYDGLEYLRRRGFNILRHILYDDSRGAFPTSTEVESFWKSFLTDTMDSEEKSSETSERVWTCTDSEEKSSETSECVWTCTVCVNDAGNDLAGEGFKNFTQHLRSLEHRKMMLKHLPRDYKLRRDVDEKEVDATPYPTTIMLNNPPVRKVPTQEEAGARTWVIWDIKSCPLPSGCDACRLGPCIKRALEKSGYSGPLTITAIGHLIDVPQDVIRSVSSTGISLQHIPLDVESIGAALAKLGDDNKHSANILLISARDFSDVLKYLKRRGFNILRQILYDDSLVAFPTTTELEGLWKSFLTDTMDLEEKSSETRECDWLCTVCADAAFTDLIGKGFEIFIEHLQSQEHRERMLEYLPCIYKLKREEDKEEVEVARMQLRLRG